MEESVAFTLRFPSGVIAQCGTSYGVHESRELRVHTANGAIALHNAFAYRGQRLVVAHREGGHVQRDEPVLPPRNQFALELDHMAACILDDRAPRTPGEEGLQDMILMEAIYEAARTGAPVKVGPLAGTKEGRTPPVDRLWRRGGRPYSPQRTNRAMAKIARTASSHASPTVRA